MIGLSLKMLRFCLWAAVFVAAGLQLGPAFAQTVVDLELVIAVDVSLSMDLDEQRLQRDGYVMAFRDPEVHKAIASGPNGRIAVTYMEWAGPPTQQVVMPWTVIDSAQAARAFADRLEAAPISRARMTSISAALQYLGAPVRDAAAPRASAASSTSRATAPTTPACRWCRCATSWSPRASSSTACRSCSSCPRASSTLPSSTVYYTDCVIGGTGSFMIPIKERGEFRTATRRKLLLEIAGYEPPARLIRTQAGPPAERFDCLVGEKQWRNYMDGRFPN